MWLMQRKSRRSQNWRSAVLAVWTGVGEQRGSLGALWPHPERVPPERFLQVIQTNIVGVYNGSFVAMQHFVGQGQGKLINIFGHGDTGPQPFQNAYASSKYWVSSFTRALAKRVQGLRRREVIGYNPGLVITDLLTDVEAAPGYEQQLQQLLASSAGGQTRQQCPARGSGLVGFASHRWAQRPDHTRVDNGHKIVLWA